MLVFGMENAPRDLDSLVVVRVGAVVETGDVWEPYRLVGPSGEPVAAVTTYLGELQAAGRSAATQRSYAMALLRWFRFLWSVEISWQHATRVRPETFRVGSNCPRNRLDRIGVRLTSRRRRRRYPCRIR